MANDHTIKSRSPHQSVAIPTECHNLIWIINLKMTTKRAKQTARQSISAICQQYCCLLLTHKNVDKHDERMKNRTIVAYVDRFN